MSDWYAATEEVRAKFDREVQQVRSDERISISGKRARLARAWLEAEAATTRLHDEGQRQQAEASLRRQQLLFGVTGKDPGEIISRRDALDRAEAAQSPDDGRRLWERARSTDDRSLSQAVLRVACDRWAQDAGWRDIIETWGDEHPAYADDLRAYIGETRIGRSARATQALIDSMHTHVARPTELAALSDQQLESLAAE